MISLRSAAFSALCSLLTEVTDEVASMIADKGYLRDLAGKIKMKEIAVNTHSAPLVAKVFTTLLSFPKSKDVLVKEFGSEFEGEMKKIKTDLNEKDLAEALAKVLS